MPDLREGCMTGEPSEDTAPADALVLFGAMGDLAHKKIFPALYHMVRRGHLDAPIIGIARAGRTNAHLIERARDSVQKQDPNVDQKALAKLLKLFRYVGGDYQDPETFHLLKKTLGSAGRPPHYLAIPPSLFTSVVESFVSTTSSEKRQSSIFCSFASPIAVWSRSGSEIMSRACRSQWPKNSGSRVEESSTMPPARSGMWSRIICFRW